MARKRVPTARVVEPTTDAVNDSFKNLVSGLGTERDKSTYTRWMNVEITADQLEAAYRNDWLSRKIVDIPAQDATREWRQWQADAEQITALEKLEKRLHLRLKVRQAIAKARLYGGAALVLGVDVGQPEEELLPEQVTRDALKYVHVLNRYEITARPLILDLTSPYYGEPEWYERSVSDNVRIHPSRVIRFVGAELPDIRTSDGWGDSVLKVVSSALLTFGVAHQGTAAMVTEASIDVIRIPGLTKNISTAEYENRLKRRFQLASLAKSMFNMLLLDKEEEWDRITQAFAGLPDLMRIFLQVASGAADIPVTRLLGESPSGLNSTGESDIRNYYDKVRSEQEMHLTPAMERLDEVLIRSALGTRPDDLHYEWRSLWQMTEAQRAEIDSKKASTFKIDVDAGVLPPEVLRQARINQLIEDGTYPGLEQIVEENAADFEVLREQELQPDRPPAPALTREEVVDATPRTLYVRRDVLNAADIVRWARGQGLRDVVPAKQMHVTIMYSLVPVDWARAGEAHDQSEDGVLAIAPGGARFVEKFGDTVVLGFASSALSWRHENIKYRTEAEWQFPDYQPHISVVKHGGAVDVSKIEPYRGPIRLGPEIFEEIRETEDGQ